jgi:transposase
MLLRPLEPPTPPEETRRVARAAFPKGTLCLRIADALGPVYQDSQFAALFPRRGRPAEAPGRLALAMGLQFVGNLSDREAADAVRARIDWKYALGLALTDPGFDHTVLSEFRLRLIEGKAELLLLDAWLRRLQEEGRVKARAPAHTGSPHVLAAVRGLNRLERVGATLWAALNKLEASIYGCSEVAVVVAEVLPASAAHDRPGYSGWRARCGALPKTGLRRERLAARARASGACCTPGWPARSWWLP